MRTFLVALLATPAVVLLACSGVGYEAERENKYQPEPAQRVAEAVTMCRRAGFPVVRLEVSGGVTRIRCATLDVVVQVKGRP